MRLQWREQTTCSGDDFLAGTLSGAVLAAFDIMELAEARGLLRYRRLPPERQIVPTDTAPLAGRPHIRRDFSSPEQGMVWFIGRTLAIDVRGQDRVEVPMAEAAEAGLDACRAALGDALIDRVVEAARALSPLPCFCGTGCQRIHEHDALMQLSSCSDPRAPIDRRAALLRCRVCGRWWTYQEEGDSHYSYHYTVRQFTPDV